MSRIGWVPGGFVGSGALVPRAETGRFPLWLAWAIRYEPGSCAVCGEYGPLKCDHCKHTSMFRGFICHRCNVTLAKSEDDPDRLRQAGHVLLAAYIESSEAHRQKLAGVPYPPLRERAPFASADRPGDLGVCPGCKRRVLKGEQYVPAKWQLPRRPTPPPKHDWHVNCLIQAGAE